jgi:lysophospholipase L1-like esterase
MSAARWTGRTPRRATALAAVFVAAALTACAAPQTSGAVVPRAAVVDGATAGAHPPARSAPMKVLALGDSITVGFDETGTTRGGYRLGLWQRLVEHDRRSVEFVGSQHTPWGPGVVDLPHEGHGGYRIDQIRAELDRALWVYAPDVVLVHLGTNDIGQGYAVDSAPDRLAELAARVCGDLPDVDLAIAAITPMPGAQWEVDAFNARVPQTVADLRSWGCRAREVDMAEAVAPTELYDGVHPTSVGYDHMAAAWYPLLVQAYDGTF